LFLGQKDTPNPAMTFFLFFIFRERLFVGRKILQYQRRTIFRVPDFGALGLVPPPPALKKFPPPWKWAENVSRANFFLCLYRTILKRELEELQIYFKKILLHQQKFLVVSVLSNSPWLPRDLKKYPK